MAPFVTAGRRDFGVALRGYHGASPAAGCVAPPPTTVEFADKHRQLGDRPAPRPRLPRNADGRGHDRIASVAQSSGVGAPA